MKITKQQREMVFQKYEGKCAYCGCDLQKGWHVDHIEPAFHNWSEDDIKIHLKRPRGLNVVENYNPSCARCNRWKSTWTIEQFRNEISMQINRLKRDSPQFRLAIDYGLVVENTEPIKFYFEAL